MKTKVLYILLIALFMSACEETITYLDSDGAIHGKIALSEDLSGYYFDIPSTYVRVPGTTGWIQVDDNLEYTITNLPAGHYALEAMSYDISGRGYLDNVIVESGEVTQADDIIFEQGAPNSNLTASVTDSAGNRHFIYNNLTEILLPSRKVIVRVNISNFDIERDGESVFYLRHDQQVYEKQGEKGLAVFEISLGSGLNEIEIWSGESQDPGLRRYANLFFKKNPTSVNINLGWATYDQDYVDAGDFDLILIHNETGDSVHYKNKNPDWGILGAEFDDPNLDDNTNPSGYYHIGETLSILAAARGTYTVKVHYYSNYGSPETRIRPNIRLDVGGNRTDHESLDAMAVGDTWEVVSFFVE